MDIKTIKGVDEETWMEFKALAVKKRLTMSKLLAAMIKEYSKSANKVWNEILYGRRILSNKEADDLHIITKKIRKESWVRNAARS